ncbi:phosphatidylserine decarboxylase-domain-containing protein [Aspergillus pseudodeflectus]|uniref:Phosphatidylserine decarboxylase-domain-containing protein n=1 Tax=Aspergillus pseudodeflectus TaxID=176178 RepID=A0ABR4JAF4_9EURO
MTPVRTKWAWSFVFRVASWVGVRYTSVGLAVAARCPCPRGLSIYQYIKPGSRPIHEPDSNSSAVIVADSRVVFYEAVAKSKKIWIKGEDFSITNLVMDKKIGPQFHDGPVASFRLSPQDYHRYHSPVTGKVKMYRSMPGDYYDVDPLAIRSGVDILTRNARDYVVIETEEFGEVLFVAIGASQVGTVEINEKWQKPGAEIKKGDELGIFQFGGSSIIVAFQKGRIQFDEDALKRPKGEEGKN